MTVVSRHLLNTKYIENVGAAVPEKVDRTAGTTVDFNIHDYDSLTRPRSQPASTFAYIQARGRTLFTFPHDMDTKLPHLRANPGRINTLDRTFSSVHDRVEGTRVD